MKTRQMARDPSIGNAQSKVRRYWPSYICSKGRGKRGEGDAAHHPGILDMPNGGREPRGLYVYQALMQMHVHARRWWTSSGTPATLTRWSA